jgi:hypothetical protein
MYHMVNVLKEISKSSIVIKIPFYFINLKQWHIESWFTKENQLIIKLEKKEIPKPAAGESPV